MKKAKKMIAVLLAAIILMSSTAVSAFAENEANKNSSLYEELLASGKLEEINKSSIKSNSIKKQTMSRETISKINNNRVLKQLSLTSGNIKSFNTVCYDYNPDIKYETEFDNGSIVSYDRNMNIIAYSNFDRNSDNHHISTMSSYNDNDKIIEALKQEYGIDETYALDINNNDNGDIVYYWEKIDENGCRNIYDSLSVRIDGITNKIVTFNRFNDSPQSSKTIISEDEAKSIALNLKEDFNHITSCEKKYVKPNFIWNEEEILYENADIVRLAYNVCIDDIYFVHIDAETGEVIGGDMVKAGNNAGTYVDKDMLYSNACADLAKTSFPKLGYSNSVTFIGSGSSMRNSLLNYVQKDSSAYGLYIRCHGTSTDLRTTTNYLLHYSEVKGNWHLVFLDSCSTAANSTWANAFNINSSYSKRAFLGWSTDANASPTYQFCRFFWPETSARKHSANIRDAAVWAASQVPGSGTTPIRFYGDKTYNGRAY